MGILLCVASLAGCGGDNADSDGDGLTDAQEKRGYDIIIDLLGQRVQRHVDSDPKKYDTDNDGLSDQDEFLFPSISPKPGLDPRSADTDQDGLTDCQEALHTVIADCENPDFTGPYDGGFGTQAGNADSDPGISRYWETYGFDDQTDTLVPPIGFGDGLADGFELAGYDVVIGSRTVHVVTDPLNGDSDGDGLDDGEEVKFTANPQVPDTDGDGCRDGQDAFPDREERYALGLRTVNLTQDHDSDPSKGADLRLLVAYTDRTFDLPPSGGFAIQVNVETDISFLDPAPQGPNCGEGRYPPTPFHPWLYIGVQAVDLDELNTREVLDFKRNSGPGNGEAYWNVRTGQFSWSNEGLDPFDGPLRLNGTDGELRLEPRVQ